MKTYRISSKTVFTLFSLFVTLLVTTTAANAGQAAPPGPYEPPPVDSDCINFQSRLYNAMGSDYAILYSTSTRIIAYGSNNGVSVDQTCSAAGSHRLVIRGSNGTEIIHDHNVSAGSEYALTVAEFADTDRYYVDEDQLQNGMRQSLTFYQDGYPNILQGIVTSEEGAEPTMWHDASGDIPFVFGRLMELLGTEQSPGNDPAFTLYLAVSSEGLLEAYDGPSAKFAPWFWGGLAFSGTTYIARLLGCAIYETAQGHDIEGSSGWDWYIKPCMDRTNIF